MAQLQRNGVIDDAWVEDSFSYKIIPKSSEKLLVLDSLSPRNRSLVEEERMHWSPSKQKLIADLLPKKKYCSTPLSIEMDV
jgi:hypothetical protein